MANGNDNADGVNSTDDVPVDNPATGSDSQDDSEE